jgi:pimeloyl-ACP methyl ester carboxylesterase
MRLAPVLAPLFFSLIISLPALAEKPVGLPTPSAAVADTGRLGEAPYRIEIPAGWNGGLVLLQHGYEPVGMPRTDPWPRNEATPIFLGMGYAVAESGYAAQGWAVGEALDDIKALHQHFMDRHGKPESTYLVGFSLGGLVSLAALEQQDRGYAGALSLCGVNLPAATAFADGILTPLLAFDYFFPQALGLASEGLIDPNSPPMADPEVIEAALATDAAKAEILVKRLEIPRPMLAGAIMLNYMLLREMQQRAGGHPVDNTDTVYSGVGDDAAFNRGVRRYAAAPAAVDYVRQRAELSGRIKAPVVVLNNVVDQTIPPRFTRIYPKLVAAAGRSEYLTELPQQGEGHCNFTSEQIGEAFAALVERGEPGQ